MKIDRGALPLAVVLWLVCVVPMLLSRAEGFHLGMKAFGLVMYSAVLLFAVTRTPVRILMLSLFYLGGIFCVLVEGHSFWSMPWSGKANCVLWTLLLGYVIVDAVRERRKRVEARVKIERRKLLKR